MNPTTKNKLLTGLILLLLIANAATIVSFWLGRHKHPPLQQGPADYLVKELGLNTKQQQQFLDLVSEHRKASEQIRIKIREAKNDLFDLLKQPNLSDSLKKAAAETVSTHTQELDLLTFDHFKKVRALCTVEQLKKFGAIIHDVTSMMAAPHPGGPPPHEGMPPPDGPPHNDGSMPPPQQ